jgi:transcriptional regulatory protein LevR
MAQVVRELLDVTNIIAVDMPLDMHPRVAYEKMREAVTQIDEGSGVLIMVHTIHLLLNLIRLISEQLR